jgi:phenylacetate-CoA ligase
MGFGNYVDAFGLFRELKKNQWKDPSELEEIAGLKLGSLLKEARASVPHYSALPRTDDLRQLPILEKSAIRKDPLSFVPSRLRREKLFGMESSGSTGFPLRFYFDQRDYNYGTVLLYHSYTEAGLAPFDKVAFIRTTRLPRFPLSGLLFRTHYLPILGDEQKNLARIRELRPDILFAYPSALNILALHSIRDGKKTAIRKVISSSEVLTPKIRKLAGETFGAEVRNYYGMNESWAVAWECEKGGMHVNSDSVLLEIVDDKGEALPDGRSGHILLTSLWRRSMPFIRYRTGDIGSIGGRCPCGRGLKVLKTLEGRSSDFIALPSGRIIARVKTEDALLASPGIWQCQIVQEKDFSLTLYLVTRDREASRGFKAAMEKLVGKEVPVTIVETDLIKKGPSGKIRPIVSHIDQSKYILGVTE